MRRRTEYRFGVRNSLFSQRSLRRPFGGKDRTFAACRFALVAVASRESAPDKAQASEVARAKQLVDDPAYPPRETLEKVARLLAQWLNEHAAG